MKVKSVPCAKLAFFAVSDAATNASEPCSQAGCVIAAVDNRIVNDVWATFSLLRWQTYKQEGKTQGAEMMSLSWAMTEARWMKKNILAGGNKLDYYVLH